MDAITDSTQQAYPNADIRARCEQSAGEARVLTVGIWVLPSATDASAQGRDAGLQRVSLLFPEDTFGMVMTSGLLQRQLAAAWFQQPKRPDHSGDADPDGPVHLTGIDLRLTGPDTISTKVTGFDSTPWPDVSFTVTVADRLSVDGSPNVACKSDRDSTRRSVGTSSSPG